MYKLLYICNINLIIQIFKVMKKQITRSEFKQMLSDYGHHLNVTVPVTDLHGDIQERTVLNNAIVYNPYGEKSTQVGMSSNEQNAETAMKFVKKEAKVHSSVFAFCSGEYVINYDL